MTDWKRRRLMQAGASLPLLRLTGVQAQSPDRNLGITERKPAEVVAAGTSLLVAPRRALARGGRRPPPLPPRRPSSRARHRQFELRLLAAEEPGERRKSDRRGAEA